MSGKAFAYDFKVDGIYYDILSDTTCEVTKENLNYEYDGDIIIPEQVTYRRKTMRVTAIGGAAFSGNTGLTSVEIPNSVTTIGLNAFTGCTGLTSIDIPNSVEGIDFGAFSQCTGLTSIEIPNSVKYISYGAFYECTGLTSVTIGTSVTSIGTQAFKGCVGLTNIDIPNSVEYINEEAFSGCIGLRNLNIEDGGESLGIDVTSFNDCPIEWLYLGRDFRCHEVGYGDNSPFAEMGTLTNVIIGNLVTEIGKKAFYHCWKLTSVDIPNSVESIGDYAFSYCGGLTSVTMGESVNAIGDYAFNCCHDLTSVSISNSVKSIGDYAFAYCDGLTSINIPNSVESIGNYAFSSCYGLTSVEIPNSVKNIGNCVFEYCTGLTSAIIGSSVIGTGTFDSCTGLTNVTISKTTTMIGDYAFGDCTGLTNIDIPNSVDSICGDSFSGCTGLRKLNIEDGDKILVIKASSFEDCPVETLYLGRNLEYYNVPRHPYDRSSPFRNMETLTNITVGNLVTEISPDAFYNLTGITSVIIGKSVTTISEYAFNGCTNLKELVFEDSEEKLKVSNGAFWNCPIRQLYLGRNLTHQESFELSLYNLTTLADVTIGSLVADVTAIDWTKNENLTSIKSLATNPPTSEKFTNPQYMNVKVSVPFGSLSSYKEDIVWRNFWNLQEDGGTGVNHMEANERQSIKTENGHIIVENAQGHIRVYDMAGHLVKNIQTDGGRVEISTPQHGMYIVKVGRKSVKVTL